MRRRVRVGLTSRGTVVLAMGAFGFAFGSAMKAPLLNLVGYFLVVTLGLALVLAGLAQRGLQPRAVAAAKPDPDGGWPVLVRIGGRPGVGTRVGPFGVAASLGTWGDDVPVAGLLPLEATLRAVLPEGRRWRRRPALEEPLVRLRTAPLGLVAVTRAVPVVRLAPAGDEVDGRDGRRSVPQDPVPMGALREHHPSEGLRDVHWGASARQGRLVVRLREAEGEEPAPRKARAVSPAGPARQEAGVMRAGVAVASLAALVVSWLTGAVHAPLAPVCVAVLAAGTVFSVRRDGTPRRALQAALYLAILAALAGFIDAYRKHPLQATPDVTALFGAVLAVFGWDLRDRVYMRAQLMVALILMGASAVAGTGSLDRVALGAGFVVAVLASVLAAWADGRHEVGVRRVRLRDLQDLPSAWLPLAILAATGILVYPWLPPLPLPPIPTFGFVSLREDGGTGLGLPGQGGDLALNARWTQGTDTVLEVLDPRPVRLRSEVYTRYSGGRWIRQLHADPLDWPAAASPSGRVQLVLRAAGLTTLPMPIPTLGVEATGSQLALDASGVLHAAISPPQGYTYAADLGDQPLAGRIRPLRQERSTLGLPPELAATAHEWAARSATPREGFLQIAAHLTRDYSYQLDAPVPPPGVDPIVYFLRTSHRGFCQHFASALALMGRELGIPTRVVGGYLPGHQVGDHHVVTESDAHAWVEAYLGGRWQTFDPTPAPSLFEVLTWRVLALLGLGAGTAAYATWRVLRRRRPPEATRAYLRALRDLRRHGVVADPADSPGEVLARVAAVVPAEADRWRALTAAYERDRFGPGSGA